MTITTDSLVTDDDVAAFRTNGFVLGRRLLTDAHADHVFGLIDDIVVNESNPFHQRVYDFNHGGRPLLHIKNMWRRVPGFPQLHQHPLLLDALQRLTGVSRFRLWQDRFFYKPAGAGGFHTWHQDSVYLPFLRPYAAASAWIALTPADVENGAMSMVPGSHEWGDASEFLGAVGEFAGDGRALPQEYGEHGVTVEACPVPKGHPHFHSGATWHCSGPNWSDRARLALGLFFVNADVRFDGQSVWAKDYEGEHGHELDTDLYPIVDATTVSAEAVGLPQR